MNDLLDSITADATTPDAVATPTPTPTPKPKRAKRQRLSAMSAPDRQRVVGDLKAGSGARLPDSRCGSLVWWSAGAIGVRPWVLHDALMDVDDAREVDDLMRPIGPSYADLVSEPSTPTAAIHRAVSRCQTACPTGTRWHVLSGLDGSDIVVALGQEGGTATSAEWSGQTRWVLRVDSVTGNVTPPARGAFNPLPFGEHAALTTLTDRYAKERHELTAADINQRILVVVILERLGGMRVRQGGSVYFVPRDLDAEVDRLAPAFALAGVSLRRSSVMSEEAGTYAADAHDSLMEQASKVHLDAVSAAARLDAAVAGGSGKRRPAHDVTLRRLDEVRAIRNRASALALLLGVMASDVDQALAEAEAATKRVLVDLTGGFVEL